MIIPDLPPEASTLDWALAYAKAGIYVLPVKKGSKNPGSVVGTDWQQGKSSIDPRQIAAWFAATDHDIALDLGRSGLVAIDMDHIENMPKGMHKHLNIAAYQASRDLKIDPGRGHYLFEQPEGRRIGCSTGRLGGGWGQVRGVGGVIMAQPSSHCDGGEYRWIRTAIPILPDALASKLDDAGQSETAATPADVTEFIDRHTAAAVPTVMSAWQKIWADHIAAGDSRHTSAVSVVTGALKEAAAGLFPAQVFLDWFEPEFITAKTRPPINGELQMTASQARDKLWESSGIIAWAVGQASTADVADTLERTHLKTPSPKLKRHIVDLEEQAESDTVRRGPLDVRHLESDFWKRQSLKIIHTAALSRGTSPWAVLGISAARALALVPPTVTLPPVIGGRGSLNWYCATVSISGGGKGAANAVATLLVPGEVYERNPGSGEGAAKAYILTPAKKDEPPTFRESVLFNASEVDTIGALKDRSGSTLMATLRQGFSGETLGFAYSDAAKSQHIRKHTYRMTMVIAVQPACAGPLLNDEAGGTPQRLMWFPAIDARVSENPPYWDGQALKTPPRSTWRYAMEVKIPDEARTMIIAENVKRHRGDGNALDGHAMFCREKFAFALALLDNRCEITSEDWRLSGIAGDVSAYIRGQVADILAAGQRQAAANAGALRGVIAEAADNEKLIAKDERTQRVLRWVLRKLGGGSMTNRELSRAVASRDSAALPEALKLGLVTGQIVSSDDGKTWEKK